MPDKEYIREVGAAPDSQDGEKGLLRGGIGHIRNLQPASRD